MRTVFQRYTESLDGCIIRALKESHLWKEMIMMTYDEITVYVEWEDSIEEIRHVYILKRNARARNRG